MKRVSIHQPNFFPWLGYFQKIVQSDVHIILDDVLAPKTGASWTNRVRLLGHGSPRWLTVPLLKEPSRQYEIRELKAQPGWQLDCKEKLSSWYRDSRYFKDWIHENAHEFDDGSRTICDWNISINFGLLNHLEIRPPTLVRSSALHVSSTGTERLRDLIKGVEGCEYVIGQGSGEYFERVIFEEAGITVTPQRLSLGEYPQLNTSEFVPGLSILDVYFNAGPERLRELILNVA